MSRTKFPPGYVPPQDSEAYLNLTIRGRSVFSVYALDQYGDYWIADVPEDVMTEGLWTYTEMCPISRHEGDFTSRWIKFVNVWVWQYLAHNWRDLRWRPLD